MVPVPSLSLGAINMGVDMVAALRDTDAMGLICLILLLVLSVRSIYYMITKHLEIRTAKAESLEFVDECLEGHKSLKEIFKSTKEYPNSPLASLMREAYLEYESEVVADAAASLSLEQRLQIGRTSVESALERTIAAEMRKLESKLTVLATASTLGPFIGLFGTVWGVLGAFQALGQSGHAGIQALAPGISTALTTTIFGLIVAIPAAAMYNRLASDVAHLASQMDSFAHELSNVFQKHLLRRE